MIKTLDQWLSTGESTNDGEFTAQTSISFPTKETVINASYTLTSTPGKKRNSMCQNTDDLPFCRALTYDEAFEYVYSTIKALPIGSQFTCYALFHNLRCRFDRRRLGNLMMWFRKEKLIQRISYVPESRENGNNSIVALYKKKRWYV